MPETIQDRVLRVISTTQRIPIERVTPQSSFEDLGIDSMDSINILFDLESEFDIEINDEDAKKIHTIEEMIAGVTFLVENKDKAVENKDKDKQKEKASSEVSQPE